MKPMPKRPHAQIHLPALTPEEALLLANIFDRASDAVWRAHGRAMADFLYLNDDLHQRHAPDPPSLHPKDIPD